MPEWTDINQLDGVTFGDDTLFDYQLAAPIDFRYVNVYPEYDRYTELPTYDTANFFSAGTIRVIDATYVAPVTDGQRYLPPVFGTIEASYVRNGRTRVQEFQIRGFSEQGILLSLPPENPQDEQTSLSEVAIQGRILSPSGFGLPDGQALPITFGYDPAVFDTSAICFAEGTRLLTPTGARAVEDLREGDLVLTAGGAARPVRWIGHMVARPARHPRPHQVQPVRVTAGAFAPGVPAADVRLSPGHAVHVDGVLVPVHHLVNGATIVQEAVERVRYFHVELETHDVLLAEGLPCESYLDDGNRAAFANAGDLVRLHGRPDPADWADACAAMVNDGPRLVAIRERLHARALELGWHCEANAAVRLVVDGAELAPVHAADGRFWFALPATPVVTLCSRAAMPVHTQPDARDTRLLGVAVAEVRVDGVTVPLDAPAFGAGFHVVEQDAGQAWRWTDGAAVLALDAAAPVMLEIALCMAAPCWTRAAPRLAVVA